MVLTIYPRGSRIPKLNSKFLEPDTPQTSVNVNTESGNLKPLKGLLQDVSLTKPGDLRSVFKLGANWLTWTQTVDVVKAQIAGSDDRFFYTGDSAPKQSNLTLATQGGNPATYPAASRPLGVTAPTSVPTITILGTPDTALDPAVVSYVYTYVSDWGEESGPSPVTVVTTIPGGQYVKLTNFVNPGISYITGLRVYRVETGTSGNAEYQLIYTRPVNLSASPLATVLMSSIVSTSTGLYDANSGTSPTGLTSQVGEVLPSDEWAPPPTDMVNLIQFQNGILAGSSGQYVCFSEVNYPYAWPIAYRKALDYNVVGLGVFGNTLVALTGAYPYLIQGTDPTRTTLKKLEYKQGCVSKRGIVSTRDGVIYPSPDGLFMVDASSVINLTQNIFTADQWAALVPSSLIGFFFNDAYYGFFQGSGVGIIISIESQPKLQDFSLGTNIYGGFVDPATNTLCLLGYSSGYKIYKWGDGNSLTYTWKSKKFEIPQTNMGVVQIRGPFDAGNITFTLYADGVAQTSITVTGSSFYWLPQGFTYTNLEVHLSGQSEVDQIVIAHDPEELTNV